MVLIIFITYLFLFAPPSVQPSPHFDFHPHLFTSCNNIRIKAIFHLYFTYLKQANSKPPHHTIATAASSSSSYRHQNIILYSVALKTTDTNGITTSEINVVENHYLVRFTFPQKTFHRVTLRRRARKKAMALNRIIHCVLPTILFAIIFYGTMLNIVYACTNRGKYLYIRCIIKQHSVSLLFTSSFWFLYLSYDDNGNGLWVLSKIGGKVFRGNVNGLALLKLEVILN